ncbi:molybdopterin molybdotransferase MoeA [Tissierella pigra]|uniref:Molybdopterin molybdenumtransferase n=1 Tax=Tissierella pigra TaxID=2607614 RepID=A0A6N7Y2H5_9FIRM|nr:gephyrin-like molybdotransferase Glp [Tissierella pigra]MBU5425162.1 molybdopterin molybdotransferase MoeA [Tissierella pigra]MSU02955.1 molybdopterin molybdotransferase MoeA [Tissierella pigra]
MKTNISIEEANRILEEQYIETSIIEISLLESQGYVLAENIKSNINIPPFNRSPLDGYAYKSEDTLNAAKDFPTTLKVIDSIQAGYVSTKSIGNGEAIRIMTGAKIPEGANVVMKYEDTEFTDKDVKIFHHLEPESNIVKKGEDIKVGDVVLSKGVIIDSAEIGILASLGISRIKVYAKPKVAILATGDELVDIYEELKEGKIRNSNSYTIAAQAKRWGGDARILGICKDNIEEAKKILEEALKWANIVVTTGGASVGDADIIKEVFHEIGGNILFWKTQMKPGSPIVVGKHGNKFLFGLSGNPAAAFITFEQFVRPIILRLAGKEKYDLMEIDSILEDDFIKISNQDRYVRGYTYKKNGQYYTSLPNKHSSGVLSSLSGKNSLFLVKANTGPYKKGDKIKVELINYLEVE